MPDSGSAPATPRNAKNFALAVESLGLVAVIAGGLMINTGVGLLLIGVALIILAQALDGRSWN